MTARKKLRPPIKIHGGKYYLSQWIISNFPKDYQDMTYVEPYCGGASVFLNKKKSKEEVLNDLNLGIVQIFRALRDEPNEFIGRLKRTKYTESTFERTLKKAESEPEDYLDQAVTELVLRRMSRGGLKKAFAWSNRKRGGKPGDVNAWETCIYEQLPLIAERLEGTFVLHKPALEVIKAFNDPNVLLYVDPPYLPSTRTAPAAYGEQDMTDEDHIKLLETLATFQGKVILSGYASTLYNRSLKEWKMKKKQVANHSAQTSTKKQKTECLWINY